MLFLRVHWKIVGVMVLLCLFAGRSWADLLKVPNDHLTIQEAIDASRPGDTIVVASGTFFFYSGNITIDKESITLRSSFGPDTAIIKGRTDRPVITFSENCHATIQGFTITGLDETEGESLKGGGVYCGKASAPTIIDCVISNNRAVMGGGIYCDEMSSPKMVNVRFVNNRAKVSGGGVFAFKAFPDITRSRFVGNRTSNTGGGFHSYKGAPRIRNSLFWKNVALSGGGVSCDESLCSLINNTIVENRGASYGGGVFIDGGATKILNCIVWENGDDLYSESFGTASRPDHTNISDGDFLRINGNLSENPMFVDMARGDFRLMPESPCRDAGHSAAAYNDTDGSRNDMGAYGGPEAKNSESVVAPNNEID